MAIDLAEFDRPAWLAAAGTGLGYALLLAVLTLAMFIVPWLVFAAL